MTLRHLYNWRTLFLRTTTLIFAPTMSSRYTRYNGPSTPTPSFIRKDLGDVLRKFSPAEIIASKAITVSNVQEVASYSWIDAPMPTIAVPSTICHFFYQILLLTNAARTYKARPVLGQPIQGESIKTLVLFSSIKTHIVWIRPGPHSHRSS